MIAWRSAVTNKDWDDKIASISGELYDLGRIAAEIIEFTGQDACRVWQRLAQELHRAGTTIREEGGRFDITPHIFNDAMLRFYRESDGFIYETLIDGRNPRRMGKWFKTVRFLLKMANYQPSETRVLVYGDSAGSDCIFLRLLGFDVTYHDYDSYCSHFAQKRFDQRKIIVNKLVPANDTRFDFIICLEVAEHAENPVELINDLVRLTKPGGYCIFTESFHMLSSQYPTHLSTNTTYSGKADHLFKDAGMYVHWKDIDEKPIIYSRRRTVRDLIYSKRSPRAVSAMLKLIVSMIRGYRIR